MSLFSAATNYRRYMDKISVTTNLNIDTSKAQIEKLKFYHFHLKDTKDKRFIKHMSLATKVINDHTIIFGVSFCSSKDKFDKEIGKELAYAELVSAPKTINVTRLKAKKILRKVFGYLALHNKIKDAEYIILFHLAKYLYNV